MSGDKSKKDDKKMPPKRAIIDKVVKNAKVPTKKK